MASQHLIFDVESDIVDARANVERIIESVRMEGQFMGDGKVYPENRDCWGTLLVNAQVLRNRLDTLVETLENSMK